MFFIILFRKNKRLTLIHFNYSDKYLFRNSIVIINYRFKNAIYYKFGNHLTTDNQIKLFNLEKVQSNLPLTVYGFFRKEQYILKFEAENILINRTFKTEFINLNPKLVTKMQPQSFSEYFTTTIKKIRVNTSDITLNIKAIETKHNSFNQTDFL